MKKIINENFNARLRNLISVAWTIFAQKVGNGLIQINKEASMQLHYAYILKQMLDLIIYNSNESISLELETGLKVGNSHKEVDILLKSKNDKELFNIAIEMKCYKTYASSGGKRGATDIFMKDVYKDLYLLEKYCKNKFADLGVSLIMNDYENFVNPKNKAAKCWDYDISDGTKVSDIHLTTDIGGKKIDIRLKKSYEFKWLKYGNYWFAEIEGK